MRDHRSSLAAFGALLVAGGFGSAGLAHEGRGDKDGDRSESVIVITDLRGGDHDGKRRVHTMRIDGDRALADCESGRRAEDSSSGDREGTRIIVCDRSNLSATQRIEKLERAVERINASDGLSAEHKERVAAALREAIGRIRTAP